MNVQSRVSNWRNAFRKYLTNELTNRPQRRAWSIERLEERALMIVGAAGDLPGVPIDQFTGVVHFASTAVADPRCSGSLLESGRHILTAAHCVAQNEDQQIDILPLGGGPVGQGSFVLIFNGLPTAAIPVGAAASVVENALEALPNITNVRVASGPNPLGYSVAFVGEWALQNVNQMTVVSGIPNGLAVVSTVTEGGPRTPQLRFDLPSGSYVFSPEATDIVIHPAFKNLSTTDEDGEQAGFDIAIITLPAIAPDSAERYDVYEDLDEDGQEVMLVGYGLTGNGAQGETANSAGIRRAGINRIDGIHATTGYLRSDFDDGQAANNVLGDLGEGNAESMVVRGDSGGPGLVDGRIAGLHASATSSNGWGTFGQVLYMTRVSDFVQNRDPMFDIHDIIQTPDDVVLDMDLQDVGNNSLPDEIDVELVGVGNNRIRISINGNVVWSELRNRVLSLEIRGSDDRDIVRIIDNLNIPVRVYGNDGDDSLTGGSGAEIFYGGNGQDVINGGGGNDELYGESNNDTLRGDSGSDLLIGGSGTDYIYGGTGNDRLIGGRLIAALDDEASDSSRDYLYGEEHNDTIIGDDGSFIPLIIRQDVGGNDVIRGGSGNDLIFGGFGADNIHGQEGNDTIFAGAGNDVVLGGSSLAPAQSLPDGDDTIDGGTGNDAIYGDNSSAAFPAEFSELGGNDTLIGGPGDDSLFGQALHDTLRGDDGNDTLHAGVGNDSAYGGTGDDTIIGDLGADLLFGDSGDDNLQGGNDIDILAGGIGNDALFGDQGNDTINGEDGNDLAVGGPGEDRITGGVGNDTLIGGNQSLIVDTSADTIDGDEGDDLIIGDSARTSPSLVFSLNGGGDTIQGGLGNDTIYAMHGNDFVGGGLGNDQLFLGAGDDIASGDSGDDTLEGGIGNDILAGGAGIDQLTGEDGDDWLIGGFFAAVGIALPETEDDTLDGGSGHDRLLGDSWSLQTPLDEGPTGGNDLLIGGIGNDFLAGQVGNDVIRGGDGNDELAGGTGNDTLFGDAGNDRALGGIGNDVIRGGDGDDELLGGSGHDILVGGSGVDALFGNDGRDLLIGGVDADRMNGNAGDDLLIGGTTRYDASDNALGRILQEWTSPRSYSSRVANIRGLANPEYFNRLNGDFFFRLGTTVFDDQAVDRLTGETGADWFFADLAAPPPDDELADRLATEAVN